MADAAWVVNEPRQGLRSTVSEVWGARELVTMFALRDLRIRYRQATLGVLWVLAQPLAAVLTLGFVFSHVVKVGTDHLPYPVFALVGLTGWTYFSSVVSNSAGSLVTNAALLTKVYFPRAAAPVASLVAPLVDLGVALLLVVVVCAAYGVGPGWSLLFLPVWLAWLVLAAFGPALWLSALNVRFRDVGLFIGPLLQAWLFLSPVAYSASRLHGVGHTIYYLNPIAGPISVARWTMVAAPWPGAAVAVSAAVSLVVLAGGFEVFRRTQTTFADVI